MCGGYKCSVSGAAAAESHGEKDVSFVQKLTQGGLTMDKEMRSCNPGTQTSEAEGQCFYIALTNISNEKKI